MNEQERISQLQRENAKLQTALQMALGIAYEALAFVEGYPHSKARLGAELQELQRVVDTLKEKET